MFNIRSVFGVGILSFSFSTMAFAGDFRNNISGIWEYSDCNNANLNIQFNSANNNFTGNFINISNDSTFSGNTYYARGETLISFLQTDSDYFGTFSGKMLSSSKITGTTYYVNTSKQGLNFCMVKSGTTVDSDCLQCNNSTTSSTVKSNLDIHIPSATFGSSNIWVNLEYKGASGFDHLWKLKDYGVN